MSKTPEFWRKFKRKSNKQLHSTHNNDLPEVHDKGNRSKGYISNEYHGGMKNKHLSKGNATCENIIDKTKLDKKYIESLLNHLTELKNRINVENNPNFKYPWHNEHIGDFNSHSFKEYSNKRRDAETIPNLKERRKTEDHWKSNDCIKNVSDHGRGIYTVTGPNKSNASVVMSLHSTSKNTFIKINSNADTTKHFQDAAEDFIQQAEELKNKITYMLECCTCETSSCSDHSLTPMPSDKSTVFGTDEVVKGSCSELLYDRNIKRLLNSLNNQYQDILQAVTSIDKQMKMINKSNKITPYKNFYKYSALSTTPANVCAYTPESIYGNQNIYGRSEKPITLKKGKQQITIEQKSKIYPHLDPIVLIYEPIKPTNDFSKDKCLHCGHRGDENLSMKNQAVTLKKKKENLKYGFVVTYTPNISSNSNVYMTRDMQPKTTKKKKKHCCC